MVSLQLTSCHRNEIFANMSPSQFLTGMRNPQIYFPYVPGTETDKSKAELDANFGFGFDRYENILLKHAVILRTQG